MNTLERTILTALMRDMRAAGYQPAAVWIAGCYVMAAPGGVREYQPKGRRVAGDIRAPLTDEEVFEILATYDSSPPTLHFTHKGKLTWGNRGVMIVEGNGEDIISDYHVADGERFGEIIEALYERISEGEMV